VSRSAFNLRKLGAKSPLERFHASYIPEPNSGCWLWIGCPSHGYGRLKVEGRDVRAHRYSWQIANGPVPDDLLTLHRCDVPLCVNPEHLFLGTQQDNCDDMIRKGRHSRGSAHSLAQQKTRSRGENSPAAKLTFQQVREIRVSAMAQQKLAAIYGVEQSTISRIKQGKIWRAEPC
jgi:DNA-binding transcriptional regulator YiaG